MTSIYRIAGLSRLWTVSADLGDLPAFLSTRRAVGAGEEPWNRTSEQRAVARLQDPWVFNLQETVLAALPTVALLRALDWFFIAEPSLNPGTDLRSRYYALLYPDIVSTLLALAIPLTLLLTAPIIGWSSLKSADRTPESVRRATHAYLYLDGSLGLFSQMGLALLVTVDVWITGGGATGPVFVVVALMLMGVWVWALAHEIHIMWSDVPRALFRLNGYGDVTHAEGPAKPPRAQYILVGFVGTVLIGLVVSVATVLVAQGIAHLASIMRVALTG